MLVALGEYDGGGGGGGVWEKKSSEGSEVPTCMLSTLWDFLYKMGVAFFKLV